MGNINVLSFEIANLIAAGEVVERPSSVIKELIENSIDAGAKHIVAEIKHGGVSMIRVSDDGCGMEKEDLPVSLKRHATSKIHGKEDLAAIMTLGFRGEALAAISSVSEVTIITKTKNAEAGSMLVAEGGKIVDLSEVGAADGTTVVVENLFYNVPARRKFLKKDATEAMNVAALIEKVALSRPDVSIQLLVDGEEKYRTPGDGELQNALRSVYGKDFASRMLAVDGTADGVRVHGFIGRSDNNKKNRNGENFFINGRYIKSLTAQAALEKAFTSYMAPEVFPVCALFLETDPGAVDVNVHPAKLEVKFSDERKIFEAIYYSVKEALENAEYRPEFIMPGGKRENPAVKNPLGAFVPLGENTRGEQISLGMSSASSQRNEEKKREPAFGIPPMIRRPSTDADRPMRVASGASESFDKASKPAEKAVSMTPKDSLELLARYAEAKAPASPVKSKPMPKVPEEQSAPAEEIPEHRIIGEAFDTYVFVEVGDGILVIDKHAAHERVLFEKLKKDRLNDGRIASQQILFPITVTPSPDELAAANEFRADILATGFEFSAGEKTVDITAVPDLIDAEDAESLFAKMLSELAEGQGNPENTEQIRREKALYQIACKAAIKGGRKYDPAVLEWLVGRLLLLPDITVCPHGRPIAYRLSKTELDRRFDRIK